VKLAPLFFVVVLLVSSPVQAQYIDSYSKHYHYILMAGSINTSLLASLNSKAYAHAVEQAPDLHGRAQLLGLQRQTSGAIELIALEWGRLYTAMLELYSKDVTPSAFGKKRPTKPRLKKHFIYCVKALEHILRMQGKLLAASKKQTAEKQKLAATLKAAKKSLKSLHSMIRKDL